MWQGMDFAVLVAITLLAVTVAAALLALVLAGTGEDQ